MAIRDRAEYQRQRRAKDPEAARAYQRAQYAKHREKRLAAKKAARDADVEASKAYQRAMYAKHAERRAADAREYRKRNRDDVNARAMERYYAKHDSISERRKQYRAKTKEADYAKIREWCERNPHRVQVYRAKIVIAEQVGCRVRDVTEEMAQAKIAQLSVSRAIRELKNTESGA
jgi:hypothetical protein